MAESGFVKPKEYDWKDSNVALFGSDLDRGNLASQPPPPHTHEHVIHIHTIFILPDVRS